MWFSVYEVAKARCLDPEQFTAFATKNNSRYGVELHAWGEIVVDASELATLLDDFRAQFPESANVPADGEEDPSCDWQPLDFFKVDAQGKRIWSEGNPKWTPPPPVVKRRLP